MATDVNKLWKCIIKHVNFESLIKGNISNWKKNIIWFYFIRSKNKWRRWIWSPKLLPTHAGDKVLDMAYDLKSQVRAWWHTCSSTYACSKFAIFINKNRGNSLQRGINRRLIGPTAVFDCTNSSPVPICVPYLRTCLPFAKVSPVL